MTTIVYSRKTRTMSADRLVTAGNKVAGHSNKIKDFGKYVVGVAGDFHIMKQILTSKPSSLKNLVKLINSFVVDAESSFTTIIVEKPTKRDNEPTVYFGAGNKFPVVEAEWAMYYAVGSGADFALGAMHSGSSTDEAIEIASCLDTSTSPATDSIKIT